MGRGQKWEEWPQSSYSAPQWQLWRGSWPKNQKPVEDTKTLAFPHYDAGARPKGVSKGAHKGKHGWDTTEDYTTQPGEPWGKDLQDGLNQARKAEQRVRQLASTREAKVLQWQRYQEGLKRSFMQERLRHQKDIDKISEDLALAMQNQELAREQIVQIVDKAKTGYSGRQEMEDAQNAEWEQMKGDWMQEYAELDTPEAVIQRAMAARSRQAPSTEQLSARPPPGLHSYQAPGPTPADPGDPFMSAMGAPNLGAPRPPYQGSPGQHTRTVPSPGSGQRRSSLPTGQRQPVKQRPPLQAANPSGPPLGDKLMAKREADTWKLDDPVRPHHTTGPPLEAPTMAPIVEPGVPGPEMVDGNGPHAGLLGQTIPTGPGPGEVHIIEADEETDHELMEGTDVAAALSKSLSRPVTAGDIWATEALRDVQFQGLDPFDVDDYVLCRLPSDEHPHAQASLQARAASGPGLLHRLYFDVDWNPGDPDELNEDPDSGSEDNHEEEPDTCVAASDSETDPNDVLHARFLVLRLYCTLLPVDVDVRVPATIQEAADAVAHNMPADVYTHFSELVAVFPQVDVTWGAMLAVPAWARNELVVVLDVRQVDGRLFAVPIANAATYAHFCAAAGLPADGTYSIFPFGSGAPMLLTDVVETRLGGSVAIVPAGHRPATRGLLSTMLTTAEGEIPNVPIPPGRRRDGWFLAAVDCRPILQGWHQLLVTDGTCSHSDLADFFEVFMPEGYQPQIEGAPLEDDKLLLHPGAVLTVQYVPITSDSSAHGPSRAPSEATSRASSEQSDSSLDGPDDDTADTAQPDTPRSRSPRTSDHPDRMRGAQTVCRARCSSHSQSLDSGTPRAFFQARRIGVTCALQAHIAVHAAQHSPLEIAFRQAGHSISSLGLQAQERFSQLTRALVNWRECSVTCRVPGAEGEHGSTAAAQNHSVPHLQLLLEDGYPTSGEPAPDFARPAPDVAPEAPPAAVPLQATFLILGHGYWPEWIEVTLSAPCNLGAALATVNEGRQPEARTRFPLLEPVQPQAAPGLGILVALPRWVLQGVLVVCDTSRIDGRGLFTVFVAAAVNLASLFAIAEVPPSMHTVVYVGDMPWPMSYDHVVRPQTGQLIMFAPVEHQWLVITSLADMLLSEIGWLSQPPIPGAYQRRLWIMPETEPFHFELRPERQRQLRADIAHTLHRPPHLLRLRASSPRVADHSELGFLSSAALVAIPLQDDDLGGPVHPICILDLRPMMQGVTWQLAFHGRLDQTALLTHLTTLCPDTYTVSLLLDGALLDRTLPDIAVEDGSLVTALLWRPLSPASSEDGSETEEPDLAPDSPEPDGTDTVDPDPRQDSPQEDPQSCLERPEAYPPDTEDGSNHQTSRAMSGCRHTCPIASGAGLPTARRGLQCLLLCTLVRVHTAVHIFEVGHACPPSIYGDPIRTDAASTWTVTHKQDDRHAGQVRYTSAFTASIVPTRAVPTPCRALGRGPTLRQIPPLPQEAPHCFSFGSQVCEPLTNLLSFTATGPTLLECAMQEAHFKPLWEAVTLIETLFEHFGFPLVTPPRARTTISLEEKLPLSAFQKEVEMLRSIVPAPRQPAEATLMDWLDSDLSPVFGAAHISPYWQDYYANMQHWHTSERTHPPSHLLVYTDGSAVPSNNTAANLAGPAAWAFAVWVVADCEPFFLGACAHVAAPSGTPFHVGEHLDTPLEAELLALTWAMAWLLDAAAAYSAHVELRYDCTSAGGSIFAASREVCLPSADEGPTLAAFASQLRQTVERRFHLTHAHVKGHSQEPGNELCDILSGIARRHPGSYYDRCLPTWPAEWRKHSLCHWGWLAHHSAPDLPSLMSLESEAARLQALDMPTLAPSQGMRKTVCPELAVAFCWTAMSYNILTMFDPDAPKGRVNRDPAAGLRISGKRDLVKRQLLTQKVWIAGFQETRLPSSEVLPDGDFLMLNTAATDRGHGGCALWLSLQQPYAYVAGEAVYLQRHEATVVSISPRHLHVLLETPHLCLYVCVIHAPKYKHSTDTEPVDFWTEQTRLISRRPPRADYLLLIDSNGHVGEVQTSAIHQAGAEPENPEGALFHDFLLELSAILPSTCPDVHSGQHWTWQTPGESAAQHRLDFICIPQTWESFHLKSWVWTTFEALQTRLDHLPVCLQMRFARTAPPKEYTSCVRSICRPESQPTAHQRQQYRQALQQTPPIWWQVPIDHHCLLWTTAITQAATLPQAPRAPRPTQAYLSADTLTLVQKRQALRRYMRAEDIERQRRLMLISFAAWSFFLRGQAFPAGACAQAELWLQDVDVSLARALQLFDEHATAIRAAVKRDRIAYLSKIQQQVTLQDLRNPKALYAAVRKAFPQAKPSRRRSFQPLPSVALEDGSIAADRQQCTERWIRHFGEQESGTVVTADEYVAAFADPDIPVLLDKPLFAAADIPTLADLEQTILGLKLGKAAGPDGLTGEALRLHASSTARFLFPLCLKSALCSREPTDWRGGTLMTLAKKAKATTECASFRSILLENVAAKVQHRVLRQRLLPAFTEYRCDAQAGQIPGVGVENVGLLVRTYQRWAWSQKRPSALTYFDLKTAFYRVIRQSIVTTNEEAMDSRFLALLHDLGVPDQALPELARHLYNLSVLKEAAVSEYNIARVADLFRGSWFRLQLDSAIVLTRRGSRPGDPLADLLFAFSFTALCRSIETRLAQHGVATFVPTCEAFPPWLHWSPVDTVGLPAWADDFVHLQSLPGTVELCQQVRAALEIVAACTTSAGMILSYGEDKTAILLSANCPRAVPGLLTQDDEGKPCMSVENPITRETAWVPVVDAYRHLGTVTVANATPDAEIRYRFAQAQSMLKPLRRKLFSERAIPLALRRALLRSLVTSKFIFASSTLTLCANLHRRTWCRLYVQLWRGLGKRISAEKQEHSFEVLRAAGATSPLLALAQARATLFLRILQHGPATLLHLLHVHWVTSPATSWLQQFHMDLQAVGTMVPTVKVILDGPSPVMALLDSLQQEPGWWPKQIRTAIKAYSDSLDVWATNARQTKLPSCNVSTGGDFRCRLCASSFALRKHLAVHMARRHEVISPVRRYAPLPYCAACMRWFHSVPRVQNHLKHAVSCLTRLLHVMPPLTLEQVREAEGQEARRKGKVAKGAWTQFRAAEPPIPYYGPRQPLYAEAIADLSEEETTLERLRTLYRPHPEDVEWLMNYIADASEEGPRAMAAEFWLTPPAALSSTQSESPEAAPTCFTAL
ncbi:unnamed protein product [Symbiodinium sp. KB8]|nr:unnamed protein product [Symbiodinium sp. KB8]